MKYRTDFVTNSSSSSFLISVKNDESFDPITRALVEAEGSYETTEGIRLNTIEEVDNYLFEKYAYPKQTREDLFADDDYVTERRRKAHEAINNGHAVIFKDIAYSDDGLVAFLKALAALTDNIVILCEDD